MLEAFFCQPHSLLFRIERQHADDRPKNLLLGYTHAITNSAKDGRLEKIAIAGSLRYHPSGDYLRALLLTQREVIICMRQLIS